MAKESQKGEESVPRLTTHCLSHYHGYDQLTHSSITIAQFNLADSGLPGWMLKEIYHLKRLQSPYVPQLLDIVLSPPRLYFIQTAHQGSLHELITHRPQLLTPIYIRKLAYSVLQALAYIHESGVVHLGLNPHCILIGEQGQVMVEGYSRARMKGEEGEGLGDGYSAPELEEGQGGEMADVWAVGCVLMEMAAGRVLMSEETREKLYKTAQSPSPTPLLSLQLLLPSASPLLHSLILRVLQWTPSSRLRLSSALNDPYFQEL